ncbi:MAG: hypothetical protein HY434_02605 [Candidatus Liptonbacteria bacterium]|nr:hypothetical protein [Candidatus Liptonbacteria bacterium]
MWLAKTGLYFSGLFNKAYADTHVGGGLLNPLSGCDLSCITDKITDFLFVIGGPIAAIMVLWGGFQIMTAAGDPEKFTKGRQTILYAAIGLVVILLAKSVQGLIFGIFGVQ